MVGWSGDHYALRSESEPCINAPLEFRLDVIQPGAAQAGFWQRRGRIVMTALSGTFLLAEGRRFESCRARADFARPAVCVWGYSKILAGRLRGLGPSEPLAN
jgi:hypothetical protein